MIFIVFYFFLGWDHYFIVVPDFDLNVVVGFGRENNNPSLDKIVYLGTIYF